MEELEENNERMKIARIAWFIKQSAFLLDCCHNISDEYKLEQHAKLVARCINVEKPSWNFLPTVEMCIQAIRSEQVQHALEKADKPEFTEIDYEGVRVGDFAEINDKRFEISEDLKIFVLFNQIPITELKALNAKFFRKIERVPEKVEFKTRLTYLDHYGFAFYDSTIPINLRDKLVKVTITEIL